MHPYEKLRETLKTLFDNLFDALQFKLSNGASIVSVAEKRLFNLYHLEIHTLNPFEPIRVLNEINYQIQFVAYTCTTQEAKDLLSFASHYQHESSLQEIRASYDFEKVVKEAPFTFKPLYQTNGGTKSTREAIAHPTNDCGGSQWLQKVLRQESNQTKRSTELQSPFFEKQETPANHQESEEKFLQPNPQLRTSWRN